MNLMPKNEFQEQAESDQRRAQFEQVNVILQNSKKTVETLGDLVAAVKDQSEKIKDLSEQIKILKAKK